MYTRRIFPIKGVIKWTRHYIFLFLLIAVIPVILYDLIGLRSLRVPWLPLGVLGTAVAFIVGFKNNTSYDRLWEARKIWGGIVNSSRSWTIMLKDFITNQHNNLNKSEQELQNLKREFVYRHIAWLTALRYQMREDRPWEMHLKTKKSNKEFRTSQYRVVEEHVPLKEALEPYLSKVELEEIVTKGNKASQILGLQSSRLKALMNDGLIDSFRHMEMSKVLVELYSLQGKSERIKNFPYPRQFATLNYIFVWVFILLLPFGIMESFDEIGRSISDGLTQHEFQTTLLHRGRLFMSKHFVWFSVPFSALIAWVFHTMELIGENTENPFEGGPNDVPITDMSRGIEIDIRELINDTDIPKPYVWVNDIVM
jgi:putative membrane protein